MVVEHCRLVKSSRSASIASRKAEVDGIKEALEKISMPAPLPAAKTKSEAATRTILVSMSEMPDIVAACVIGMTSYMTTREAKTREDIDTVYANASSNINGEDYSKNAFVKRAVLRILLSFKSK